MARLAFALALLFLLPFAVSPAQAAPCPLQKKVVVDATADGGLWWFEGPYGHQGLPLATFLKARGNDVVELPRGAAITDSTFTCTALVIRVGGWGQSPETVARQVAYVHGGGQLLLLSEHQRVLHGDPTASAFGIDVQGWGGARETVLAEVASASFASAKPVPTKMHVAQVLPLAWIGGACANHLPPGAVVLAKSQPGTTCDRDGDGVLSADEAQGSVVGTEFDVGAGHVTWFSDVNAFEQVQDPAMLAYLTLLTNRLGV